MSSVAAKMHTPVKGNIDSHCEKFVIPSTFLEGQSLKNVWLLSWKPTWAADYLPYIGHGTSIRTSMFEKTWRIYWRASAGRASPPLNRSFLIYTDVHRGDVNERNFRATNAYMCHYHNESFVSYFPQAPTSLLLAPLAHLVSSHAAMP
jgi:hypothetical protein